NYVTGLRSPSRSTAKASDGSATLVGRELVASTDVNLRNGPHQSFTKIGLVEKGSTVRVLSVNGGWCEVKVLERGRPKDDPDSADQGWVDRDLLKSK
ncbi:MAG: SH3 domain-containing protein, partial [Acidobacteria bacterium]|nr:SH3 domain-containing protein [Acidobacteriota bacterium]